MPSNLTLRMFVAKSMAADATGEASDVADTRSMAFSVTWTGQTSADAVLKLQESMDGAAWFDITSASVTLDSATKKKLGPFTVDLPKVRAVISKNTETTGTVTCVGLFKP